MSVSVNLASESVNPVPINPGNMAAIWQQYYKFAFKMARPYMVAYPDLCDDIKQECYLAMVNVVEHYTPKKGSFMNYLTFWLRHDLQQFIHHSIFITSVPYNLSHHIQAFRESQEVLAGTTSRTMQNASMVVAHPVSLTGTVRGTDDVTYSELIADPNNNIEDAFESLAMQDLRRNLDMLMFGLSEKDRVIMESYYYDGQFLEEIGKELGVSRQAISQRVHKSLKQMRNAAERTCAFDEYLDNRTQSRSLRGGLGTFRTTWTSPTEYAAFDRMYQKKLARCVDRKRAGRTATRTA